MKTIGLISLKIVVTHRKVLILRVIQDMQGVNVPVMDQNKLN